MFKTKYIVLLKQIEIVKLSLDFNFNKEILQKAKEALVLLKVKKENNCKIKTKRLIILDFYIKSKVRNKEIITIKIVISSKSDLDLEEDPFSDSEFLLIKGLLN